jgi:S-adenosylmethionine hydrolase
MRQSGFPITLITDFGYTDEYVGVMKGVILSINKGIPIVDLTHDIESQDIDQAAEIIWNSFGYFPDGTVHLCVVDPDVGTTRRIIVLQSDTHFFIGPDNGIFTRVLTSPETVEVYEVENRKLFLREISNTFHGRDIMAPVAARLASGMSIANVGPRVPRESCVIIGVKEPVLQHNGVLGEVINVDKFGNIRTNITRRYLDKIDLGEKPRVTLKSYEIEFVDGSYGDIHDNLPAAIINSNGALEVCVNKGSAAGILRVEKGERVFVRGKQIGWHQAEVLG